MEDRYDRRNANYFGSDRGLTDDDELFLDRDYNLGNGVSMEREEFRHDPFGGEGYRDRSNGVVGHFGKGPRNWRPTDESIRMAACEALYRSHYVDASDIEVFVREGCVKLTGTVKSREEKRAAERCAENCTGVLDVQNLITLK